jgi:acyl-homoserine-lactone acylase
MSNTKIRAISRKPLALLLPLLIVFTSCSSEPPIQTEVLWDSWGVPHVFADSWDGAFHAFGSAQMHSHGDLLLQLYGEARGRAAEYWGEEYVESDVYIRRMGVGKRAQEWLEQQSPAIRAYLEAFTAGINDYASSNPESIDDRVEVVLPVGPSDVLAHIQRVIHLEFLGESLRPTLERLGWNGSNAWAIGPSRPENGNALLLANPHLSWSGFHTWFEAHLVAPDLNAYGATLVGFPVLAIAFNDNLGWTHTVNTMDGADLYEVFRMGDGYGWPPVGIGPDYEREFETENESFLVRQPDGSLEERELVIRSTDHGPVIAESDQSVLVARLAGLDEPDFVEQYWDMMRATDLETFESALRRLQNPFFNVIYADRDGRIMYAFAGRNPVREGNWEFWQGVIPGNHPSTLWDRTHGYFELPRIVDPESGWVQNANDPPWSATFPKELEAYNYPAYLAPQEMGFRAQRSVRMLDEDDSITFEELVEYKHSTRMELADRILDDLIPVARRRGGLARRAADVLDSWDREADADSQGAVLFEAWARELGMAPEVFRTPWDAANPRTTPDGLANPQAAVAALETVAANVEETYGALDVPWGDVYRFRFDDYDLPANGGPGALGAFRVMSFVPDTSSVRFTETPLWPPSSFPIPFAPRFS